MPKGSWREFEDTLETFGSDKSETLQDKSERTVRGQKTRGGKGGKTVTVITGLGVTNFEAKKILKNLKSKCGTGGTIKANMLELQGDQVHSAISFLMDIGFNPKKSGG